MSEILEKAKNHFRERLAAGLGSIEVPEWGTTIHFRPLNLKERDRIHRFAAQDSLEVFEPVSTSTDCPPHKLLALLVTVWLPKRRTRPSAWTWCGGRHPPVSCLPWLNQPP